MGIHSLAYKVGCLGFLPHLAIPMPYLAYTMWLACVRACVRACKCVGHGHATPRRLPSQPPPLAQAHRRGWDAGF